MWKLFTRGLKKSLNSAVDKHTIIPRTVVTQDSKQLCQNHKFLPALVESINRFYSHYYNRCSYCESEHRQNKQRRNYNAKHGSPLDGTEDVFLEALGWSSVLILGWYICQPFCRRTINAYSPERRKAVQALQRENISNYSSLTSALSYVIFSKPINYVLPEVKATKLSNSKIHEEKSWDSPEYDQYLENGMKKLEEAHVNVLGQLDNWLGTECMQSGKHAEATSHFLNAAEMENPAAMFNLGICYEMGLGITQNFHKAAEMYKKASEHGHAAAMYNLGVFHVHGWGGLDVDVRRARELFTSAASLGQKDAVEALSLEEKPPAALSNIFQQSKEETFKCRTISEGYCETESISSEEESTFVLESKENYHFKMEPRHSDSTDLLFQVLGISLPNIQQSSVEPHSNKLKSVDSGILDETSDGEFEFKINKLTANGF